MWKYDGYRSNIQFIRAWLNDAYSLYIFLSPNQLYSSANSKWINILLTTLFIIVTMFCSSHYATVLPKSKLFDFI